MRRHVCHVERLVEFEIEFCFWRDANLFRLGLALVDAAAGRAHAGPDRRTFSASGNRADNRAQRRHATHFLGRILSARASRDGIRGGNEWVLRTLEFQAH